MRKLFLAVTVWGIVLTGSVQAQNQEQMKFGLTKFNQFFRYLSSLYVDTLNTPQLVEGAITGVLSKLDPHSSYISPDEMKSVNESFSGNFEGIGIEYSIVNDTLVIVNTIPGGPSQKAGIHPNDRMVVVDGKSIVGMKQGEIPTLLRGPKGSKLAVTILRRGEVRPMQFMITRDKIPMFTLDAAYKVNENTGYIRLNRFAATTTDEFVAALNKMAPIDNLILDLRGNGGGYLDQAVRLTSQFIDPNKLVVSTEGMNVNNEQLVSVSGGRFRKGKLAILVDESSASASEIVAGAIQDWDRGVIIGRRTFGKGLVQRQIPLLDGSAVRITVARYHTPSGRVIQRPFENGHAEEYYRELTTRKEQDAASETNPKFKTLVKGRTVYGGGGITPDYTIPVDTSYYSKYWVALIRGGVISEYVVRYMDDKRDALSSTYKNFDAFQRQFNVTEDDLNDLVKLGVKRGVKLDESGLNDSKEELKTQIKALIAQRLWDSSAYFRVVNSAHDAPFQQALRYFSEP